MSERIERLISEGEINERIEQVAAQISRDYAGQSLHLICILKGAAMFMCDLAKRIRNDNVTMDFMIRFARSHINIAAPFRMQIRCRDCPA